MDIIRIEDLTTKVVYEKDVIRVEEDVVHGRRVFLVGGGAVDKTTGVAVDRMLTKTSNVRAVYTCATCSRENSSKFCSFWKKWHRGRTCCTTCVGLGSDSQTPQDKIAVSVSAFADVDEVFKKAYFRKHLDAYEFERLRPKMVSFQHDKFPLTDELRYVPALSVPSQFKFMPVMYDATRDALEKPQFFRWRCDDCNDVFETKDLCVMKNKFKALCGNCNFSNSVMKITTVKNCAGEPVTYATKFEHKFMKWCVANKVRVLNGDRAGMYRMPDAPRANPADPERVCVIKNKPSWTHKTDKGPMDVYPDTYVAFCKTLLHPGQKEAWREKREAFKAQRAAKQKPTKLKQKLPSKTQDTRCETSDLEAITSHRSPVCSKHQ